jgi:hypothetical protein
MRFDCIVAVLSLLFALAGGVSVSDQQIRVFLPYSRTTINGLPCSSFTTEAIEVDQYCSAAVVSSK